MLGLVGGSSVTSSILRGAEDGVDIEGDGEAKVGSSLPAMDEGVVAGESEELKVGRYHTSLPRPPDVSAAGEPHRNLRPLGPSK